MTIPLHHHGNSEEQSTHAAQADLDAAQADVKDDMAKRAKGSLSEHMQKGMDFVHAEPFNDSLFIRLSYEPYRIYMAAQLETGGTKWENTCRINEIKQTGIGFGCAQEGERMYPLQMAAMNLQENKFHNSMSTLLGPAMWKDLVRDDGLTMANNVFAFQLVSSIDCSVRSLITKKNQTFPVRLFALEFDPSIAEAVASTPACVLDEFSLDHINKEKVEVNGLLNKRARMKRRQICRIGWLDNPSSCL